MKAATEWLDEVLFSRGTYSEKLLRIQQIQKDAWRQGVVDSSEACKRESLQPVEHGVFSSHHRAAYETAGMMLNVMSGNYPY